MADRSVIVRLKAEVGQYKAGMADAASATSKVGTASQVADAKAAKHAARMHALGRASQAAGAAILVGLGTAMVKSVGAASQLHASMNKATITFGDQADAMRAWASTAATTMGISTNAAMSLGNQFGDMFTQLGYSSSAAADMSKKVLMLSADLGSFNHMDTADVADMISASFRGEYDSLQRIIPGISAARVQQEAMNETGKKSASTLTAQEKAAATLAIITKDGSKANGDFARTSDALGNSQKIMRAELENSQAKLGDVLMPAMNDATKAATKLLEAFNDLSPSGRKWAVGLTAAVGGLLLIGPKILSMASSLKILKATQIASTVATNADTAALNVNAVARARASAVPGAGMSSVMKADNAAMLAARGGGAGLSGMASALTGLPGLAAAAGSAISFWMGKNAAETGGLTKAISVGLIPGLSALPVALGAATADSSLKIRELAQLDKQLAMQFTNGGADTVRETIKRMAADSNQSIDSLLAKMPTLGALFNTEADKVKAALEKIPAALNKASAGFQLNSTHAIAYGRALASTARQAGKSDTEIRAMLKNAGATPREIKIVMSATTDQLDGQIKKAQQTVDGLKQYKRPDIVAKVAGFQKQIDRENKRMNDMKQKKHPDIDAIDKGSKRVALLQRRMDTYKQHVVPGINVNPDPANAGISSVATSLANLTSQTYWVTVNKRGTATGGGGGGGSWATGGMIHGPGSGTSDSIPSMLSNGEYVVRAAAVDHYGQSMFDDINARRFASGGRAGRNRGLTWGQYDFWMKDYRKKKTARKDAIKTYNTAVDDRSKAGVSSGRSLASGASNFDFSAYGNAQQNTASAIQAQADAESNLYEARLKLNTASRAERPGAIKEMAAAQAAYAKATQDTADAKDAEAKAKPTAANILANFQAKVANAKTLATNIKELQRLKYPAEIIRDVIAQGIDGGVEMSNALITATPAQRADFRAGQSSLNSDTGYLGWIDALLDPEQVATVTSARNKIPAKPRHPKKPRGKRPKKKAAGGPVTMGETYLVGEEGPELLVSPMSGTIIPSSQLRSALPVMAGSNVASTLISQPLVIQLDGGKLWNGLATYNQQTGFTLRPLDGGR